MKTIDSRWLLAGLLLLAPALRAADVTITVNGKVVARPCTVSTTRANVNLGDLYTSRMMSPGATSDWKNVTLSLTSCPVGTSRVTASFSGSMDGTEYYKNMGTASNLQLELQDTSGRRLTNSTKKTLQVNDASKSVSFPLRVRAVTVKGRPTQGSIQAVINVTYTYL